MLKNNNTINIFKNILNKAMMTTTTATTSNSRNNIIVKENVFNGPLTKIELEFFNENGYLIKNGLISDNLLIAHQIEIREYLKRNANIEFGNTEIGSLEESIILATQESKLANVSNGFGGMVNFYHGNNEYKIRQDQNLYDSFVQLYQSTYSSDTSHNTYDDTNEWPNEYGDFNPQHMFMFINRCGFRVPTENENPHTLQHHHQKGTGLHLDCNPFHLFRGEKVNADKQTEHMPLRFWQPIQAFVSCTNSPSVNQGGFWTVPKFHKKCVNYFKSNVTQDHSTNTTTSTTTTTPLKRGNAFDFQDGQYKDIVEELMYIPIKRGDVLFWDWRMPHCNDTTHNGPSIREVVYAAHLPAVPINIEYTQFQKQWYQTGKHPNYVAKKFADLETINYTPPTLSQLGKTLLSIEPFTI